MSDSVISVLTYKSVETILAAGGTQSWSLNRERAKACTFAVMCRNANTRDAEDDLPHGTAFMVGHVKDVVPSTDHDGRWLIRFSGYALVSVADQWEGRNPVAYWTTEDYEQINFDALEFCPMPDVDTAPVPAAADMGISISEAKLRLSRTFGIQPSAIEITIRA